MGRVADEETLVVPAAWVRERTPRRGSARVTAFVPDPEARTLTRRILPDQRSGGIKGMLESITTPEDVRVAALAWRTGQRDAPPLGAAAIAVLKASGGMGHHEDMVKFADLWISERGLTFAAVAAVEMLSLVVADDTAPPHQVYWSAANRGVRRLRAGESGLVGAPDSPFLILLRVRRALAAASDDEFEQVVAALEPFRAGLPGTRVACSVLVPRADWVEADVAAAVADADAWRANLLIHAAGTAEQAERLAEHTDHWNLLRRPGSVYTLVDGLGAGAAPALLRWYDRDVSPFLGVASERWLLSVLATLPGDDVMRSLVERIGARNVKPALLEAIGRYPARAMRILAEESHSPAVAELLRAHVLGHPDLIEQVRPALSPAAAARIDAITGAAGAVVTAPAEALPGVLADPPWLRRVKAAKPPVITGLVCADEPSVSWRPGEREEWESTRLWRADRGRHDSWATISQRVLQGKERWNELEMFFTEGPEETVRRVLPLWKKPQYLWSATPWLRLTAARFGAEATPVLLTAAQTSPTEYGPLLASFSSPAVAIQMADWLVRLKSARRVALAWLLRHPAEASRALIPAALGKAGTERRQAERTLLTLQSHGHAGPIRDAAAGYGPEAAAAVETLLATDPLQVLPARMPVVPAWAAPALLPPVRLRDGSGALPIEAAGHLVTVLTLSKPGEPYAGLEMVRAAVEPADLAGFGWELFRMWQAAGAVAKENWVLDALGLIGDDETVRRLAPQILTWPGEGGHAKAVTGVNVLAAIGTDVALIHLHRISQRAKFKGLKTAAVAKMDEVADGLGLSSEQLADRLVPDFGLDADGSLLLDYGPRRFVVGFDEQLRPFVAEEGGKRLKTLPKPGVRDDAELAPAAYQRFAALKKDVRTVAADQVCRLEQAMVDGRRWSGAEFRQLFAGHPLLWHIVRRLVWARFDADGTVTGTLRIAEDRTLATVDDEPAELGDDEIVGIAHPLRLGEATVASWSEVFADYEILQPFPQLGRPVFRLPAAETAGARLLRFEGLSVPATKLLGLERRGWKRETPEDGGIQSRIEKTLARDRIMMVQLNPGIAVGDVTYFEDQKLESVFLHDGTGDWWRGGSETPLNTVDEVAISEIIRDLTEVTT
ncbi:DUF4132 domain-containing protein [Actinoplanes couchii]|uniref:DUF4132 domain-containing protein n=1 Tax=Actinoplanes couchii TaxID=403638 RepID=A0ABQ3XH38_9ACTN|nr:DUF4132 domain-containing protein [Actinoplanes couchii]MDR6320716.1 hypothetical protein [Actinoplanes couchii]GID57799.1 hypothetical protein Aco03nite_062030 [Actinoplanes couchii]